MDEAIFEQNVQAGDALEHELHPININDLPSGDLLAGILKLDATSRETLTLQRRVFSQCDQVQIISNIDGLGDGINDAHVVAALARALPTKTFTLYLPQAIYEIVDRFNVPQNVIVQTGIPEDAPDNTFHLSLAPKENALDRLIIAKHGRKRPVEPTEEQLDQFRRGYFTVNNYTSVFSEDHVLEWIRQNRPDLPQDISTIYLKRLINPLLLDVDVQNNQIAVPLLKEEIYKSDQQPTYDFIIAVDAAEGRLRTVDPERSMKALSPEQWDKVFALLPPELKYGIVRGVSHPEYSDVCFQQAATKLPHVTQIVCPTLDDFIDAVNQTRVFVGMDSGTTHLSSEIANINPRLAVRDIFNGTVFRVREYGVVSTRPGQQRVLEDRPEYGSTDMSDIDLGRVVEYIKDGLNYKASS